MQDVKNEQILIVEDSKFMAKAMVELFREHLGLKADTAGDISQAISMVKLKKYDYVISGLSFSGAKHGEIIDDLNALDISPIIFTGTIDDNIRAVFEKKIIIDYLYKESIDSLIEPVNIVARLQKNRHVKVMVVDDSPSFRFLISNNLKIHRFEYIEAKNGQEALDLLEEHPDVKLIITDYHMPVMDGYEMIKNIRKKHPKNQLAIIALTTDTNSFITSKFIKIGANDFLQKPFSRDEFYARLYQNISIVENFETIERSLHEKFVFTLINAIENKSNYTGSHVKRVGEISYHIAKKIGLSEQDAVMLRKIAPLHDIGKISVSDSILKKTEQLSDDEMKEMRWHTVYGYDLLSSKMGDDPLFSTAAIVALEHHERYDGTGYPYRKTGSETHIFSKIVGISDIIDAVATKRPYKEPWSKQKIVDFLQNESGRIFEPKLAQTCVKSIDEILNIIRTIDGDALDVLAFNGND